MSQSRNLKSARKTTQSESNKTLIIAVILSFVFIVIVILIIWFVITRASSKVKPNNDNATFASIHNHEIPNLEPTPVKYKPTQWNLRSLPKLRGPPLSAISNPSVKRKTPQTTTTRAMAISSYNALPIMTRGVHGTGPLREIAALSN